MGKVISIVKRDYGHILKTNRRPVIFYLSYIHLINASSDSILKACYNCPGINATTLKDCFRPHCITADGYERGLITVNR